MSKREKYDKEVIKLERKIGVPERFSLNLLKSGNDWFFIIVLHSFIEAVLTELITKAIGRDELEDIIKRLEMINKIEYAKSLSLLCKEARRFIYKLSEIRNNFVHNIKSISMNLDQYVKNLNSDQLKNFIKAQKYGIDKEFEINGTKVERDDFIKENPRIAMWLCGYSVIIEISMGIGIEIEKQKLEELKMIIVKAVISDMKRRTSK